MPVEIYTADELREKFAAQEKQIAALDRRITTIEDFINVRPEPPKPPEPPPIRPEPDNDYDVIVFASDSFDAIQAKLDNPLHNKIGFAQGVYRHGAADRSRRFNFPAGKIYEALGNGFVFDWGGSPGNGITPRSNSVFKGITSKSAGRTGPTSQPGSNQGRGWMISGSVSNLQLIKCGAETCGMTGFQVHNGGANIVFEACYSAGHECYDQAARVSHADGFQVLATRHVVRFTRCIAKNNEDDGFDAFDGSEVWVAECVAENNGKPGGNTGTGFKLIKNLKDCKTKGNLLRGLHMGAGHELHGCEINDGSLWMGRNNNFHGGVHRGRVTKVNNGDVTFHGADVQ